MPFLMDQPVYGRPSDGHVTPLFKTGEKCQYYSFSCKTWVSAEVVATRGDGCILVNVDDDTWFSVALQRTKFRDQSGNLRGRVRVVPSPASRSPVQGSEDELDEDELERSRGPSWHANQQSRPSAVRETAEAERPRREERPVGRRVERELTDVSDDEDNEETLLLDPGDGPGGKSCKEPDTLPDRRGCGCRKKLCAAPLLGALALNVASAPDQVQKLCPRSPLPELEVQTCLTLADNPLCVQLLQMQYPADMAALNVVGVARMPTFLEAEAQKAEVFKHLAAANVTAKTTVYMESDVLVGAPIKLLLDYIRQPPNADEDLMMFGSGAGPDAAGNGGKPDASVLVLRDTQVARECLSEWSAEMKRHATGASPADPGMADVAVLRDAWTETSCFKDGSVTMLPAGWERPGLFAEPDLACMAQGRRAVFMHFDSRVASSVGRYAPLSFQKSF